MRNMSFVIARSKATKQSRANAQLWIASQARNDGLRQILKGPTTQPHNTPPVIARSKATKQSRIAARSGLLRKLAMTDCGKP